MSKRAAILNKLSQHFRITSTSFAIIIFCALFFVSQGMMIKTQVKEAGGFHYFVGSRDFRAYYMAGKMLMSGVRDNFYNFDTQFTAQQQFAPELKDPKKVMPFFNPPFVALPVVIVSFLPFTSAYVIWLLVHASTLIFYCFLVYRMLKKAPEVVRLVALALSITFLPAVNAVLQGQPSILLALALLLSFEHMRRGKDVRAGMWLSLLLIKPQFLVLPILLLIFRRRFKALLGLAGGVGALGLVSWFLIGFSGLKGYYQLVSKIPAMAKLDAFTIHPQAMHTFKGYLHLAFGTNYTQDIRTFWFIGVAVVLVLLGFIWAKPGWVKSHSFYLQWASLIVVILFVSPHANFHDVSLLLVPGLLIVKYVSEQPLRTPVRRVLLASLAVGWFVMLATLPLAALFGVQLSVLYMLAVICLIFVVLYWENVSPNKQKHS